MLRPWIRSLTHPFPAKRLRKRRIFLESWPAIESLETRVLLTAAPTNLTLWPYSDSHIELSWIHSDQADGFEIWGTGFGSGSTKIGTSGYEGFVATGPFIPGNTYSFWVRAYVDGPHHRTYSGPSNPVLFTAVVPEQPDGLAVYVVSDTFISLTWNDVANEAAYRIERSVDNNVWTQVGIAASETSPTLAYFADTEVSDATTYYYRVVAYNYLGDSAPSTVINASTLPTAPSGLNAMVVSGDAINLTWTDNSGGETAYLIEQRGGGDPGWSQIGTTEANATSFTATSPFIGSANYSFRVRARSGSGVHSDYSNISFVSTPGFPDAPTALTATVWAPTFGIHLDWTGIANATGYRVFRSGRDTGVWSHVGTIGAQNTAFPDYLIPMDGYYIYRVAAFNSEGQSASTESEPVLALTADGDFDDDDLSNRDEYNAGTDPTYFDSDDDLLSDGWEVEYGLDPLDGDENANGTPDSQDDNDGDGLDNLDESNNGADPANPDTDGDGASDADEAAQGSDPTDPTDGGEPLAEDMKTKFRLIVGDPSGSHSERWKLKVDDTGDRSGDYSAKYVAPGFGQVGSDDVWFQAGESYEIRVDHVGTDPDYFDQHGVANYDWRAWIEPTPGEAGLPYFIIDENDPPLLQENVYYGGDENQADGKVAYFHIPLLDADVDSDNNDGFNAPARTDEEDRLERNSGTGKHVVITGGDIDSDGATDFQDFDIDGGHFVPLVLSLSENLDKADLTSVQLTFTYDDSVLRIWKKDADTDPNESRDLNADWIKSDETISAEDLKNLSPGPDGKIILYVEAIAESTAAVPITITADVDGTKWNGELKDKVHMVVVSGGLVAYRPQITTGDYVRHELFGEQAVDGDDETSNTLGPGIRLNGLNDQDQSYEDDLIMIRIGDMDTSNGSFRLRRGSTALRVFDNPDATGEIAFTGSTSVAKQLLHGAGTFWVTWDSLMHGTADLELLDAVTNQVIDTVTFHTFQSQVIMIMGFTQDAQDGTVSGPGTEASAETLYKQGYDVHLYEWHEQQDASNFIEWKELPEEELQTAITDRNIEQFVMMGYSYGGGTVYDLAAEIANQTWSNGAEFALSVYVDAIVDASPVATPEDRKPSGSLAHANYYQTLDQPVIHGAATTEELGNAQILANELMNDELTAIGVGQGEGHSAIDSLEAVTSSYLGLIRANLNER